MRFICVFIFLFLISTSVGGSTFKDYALQFTRYGVHDFVQIWGMPSLTEVTVCLWMKSTHSGQGTPFSYAASGGSANELVIWDYRNFFFQVNGYGGQTSVSANDGKWHHICVAWENKAGSWKFYKDGSVAAQGTGRKTGHVIRPGGSLVLGQEQDSLGGGFVASQAFQGMLTNVNFWDHVLPVSQIEQLSKSCLSGEGNVYKWSDFINGREGKPRVLIPSPCKPLSA